MKQDLQNITWTTKYKYILVFFLALPLSMFGQIEICDNGIDDDNDNLVDINDEDCICEIIEPLSLIPNPSFEEMNCCPDDRSQLDCASDWIQASEPTTDFIHQCDWFGWPQFPPPLPFPDGKGIMGFRDGRVRSTNNPEPYWKEYAGACLLSPLLADSSYRFQFDLGFVNAELSPPINVTFFGTPSCEFLPFGKGNIAFGCPTNGPNWITLGEVRVDAETGEGWVNTSIDIVPDEDIYAIAIGPECRAIESKVSLYYFFDNLLLTNLEYFDLQISETEHPCNKDFSMSVPYDPDFEYQWYKSGIALEGEVFSKLSQHYGEGSYQVRILDGESCRISASFEYEIPTYDIKANLSICEGESYQFGEMTLTETGFYLDTIFSEFNCDSIVALELEVIGERYDTIEVSILEGNEFEVEGLKFKEEGDYPLLLTSKIGCDSLVLLKLNHFKIYFPNVFSPNGDGVNDIFYPIAADDKIKSVDMKIYDRWGNLVYHGLEWDGFGHRSNVFVYKVEVTFEFGESRLFFGTVTLLE